MPVNQTQNKNKSTKWRLYIRVHVCIREYLTCSTCWQLWPAQMIVVTGADLTYLRYVHRTPIIKVTEVIGTMNITCIPMSAFNIAISAHFNCFWDLQSCFWCDCVFSIILYIHKCIKRACSVFLSSFNEINVKLPVCLVMPINTMHDALKWWKYWGKNCLGKTYTVKG